MQLNPCTDVIYATIDQSGKVILNGTCKRNTVPTKKFSVNFVTKSLKMNGVLLNMAASKPKLVPLETLLCIILLQRIISLPRTSLTVFTVHKIFFTKNAVLVITEKLVIFS